MGRYHDPTLRSTPGVEGGKGPIEMSLRVKLRTATPRNLLRKLVISQQPVRLPPVACLPLALVTFSHCCLLFP